MKLVTGLLNRNGGSIYLYMATPAGRAIFDPGYRPLGMHFCTPDLAVVLAVLASLAIYEWKLYITQVHKLRTK
jgi:hypothetical protein